MSKLGKRMLRNARRTQKRLEAGGKLRVHKRRRASSAELEQVCAELYQVIGALAGHAGLFDHPDVIRALDNASRARLVHKDLLPWPREPLD
jgi:hypothetical protein